MKKILLLLMLSFSVLGLSAQQDKNGLTDQDKEFMSNLHQLMRMPEGTHKIYNGEGNTVFDVVYTIKIENNKWTVYKGGTQSVFDILYTAKITKDGGYTIYRGDESVFNVIFSVKKTPRGFEVYKGGNSAFPNLIYTYERKGM